MKRMKLAIWRWGGLFYMEKFPHAIFCVSVHAPEQNRYGHFTGVRGWLSKLSFRLGFHENAGWEYHLRWL